MPRAVDIQQFAPEIYILPPQRQQFAYAQPRVKADDYAVQIRPAVPQDLPLYRSLLAGGKTLHIPFDHAQSLYVIRRICGSLSRYEGALERALHYGYYKIYRACRQLPARAVATAYNEADYKFQ